MATIRLVGEAGSARIGAIGDNVTSTVLVGEGTWVGVSVGGGGVLVGMAAWVWAIIVKAAA